MPTRLPPPFHDSGVYAELDAVVIDDEPEIPIDDILEEPFVEPVTPVTRVCPFCGGPLP
jgi:hypothetical protein